MINLGSSSIKGIRLGTQRVSEIYLGETPISFNSGYNVGEYFPEAGGYVYWLNGEGGGQVALYQNIPSGSVIANARWGSVVQNVTGTFTAITSGSINTNAMSVTSGSDRAWSEIQMLNSSSVTENVGFNDWFIPAANALEFMYDNLASQNIAGPWSRYPSSGSGTGVQRSYWSSTQFSTQNAWQYQMQDGPFTAHGIGDSRKDNTLMIRPVRTFISGAI
jgi:hypothetical protein